MRQHSRILTLTVLIANMISLLSVVNLPVQALGASCVTPPSGLVSWWPGDGNANDIFNGNPGTLVNGATFAAGEVAQAFSFDGVDDYVEVSDANNLDIGTSDFTIDAWINRNPSGVAAVVSKTLLNFQTGYFFGIDGENRIYFELSQYPGGGSNWVNGRGALVPVNEWHHVAVVFQRSSTATFYIDGTVAGNFDISSVQGDVSNDRPLLMGSSETFPNRFPGLVDEVEIYSRALTSSELQSIFGAGTGGKCKLQYVFGGILQPINADGSSIFKRGSTVPVKFQLFDPATGLPVGTATATLQVAEVTNQVLGNYMEATSTAAADAGNVFRYDSTSQQYIYNLATKGLGQGTYSLKITLDDGQEHTVLISLK